MTDIGSNAVLSVFVLFCRIGSCLMLMPGFSSDRVPVNVRLFVALSITLALTPLLGPEVQPSFIHASAIELIKLLLSEVLIGILIGFLGRIFFAALETLATSIAMGIGLSSALGAPIDEMEPLPAISTLITLTATVLLFVMDLHWEILHGIVASYQALPVSTGFGAQFGLIQIADCLSKAFFLSLRVSSPFIAFAIIVNLSVGLTNKLTPQIPIFFISAPFIVAGGLFLFYFSFKQFIELFMAGFETWLRTG
ncbi:flagellar biosynthesis protein FliR [Methyloferula stellata]|uniref:flagellar biosynthesis protein FliR n=1 Tax=Methyloferula stellata TaxID=876270 RepID=UPI00035D33ED|nr:flagellar biosynthesis protein FliR [Methyloferula stellata]